MHTYWNWFYQYSLSNSKRKVNAELTQSFLGNRKLRITSYAWITWKEHYKGRELHKFLGKINVKILYLLKFVYIY